MSETPHERVRLNRRVETANALDIFGFVDRLLDLENIADAKTEIAECTGRELELELLFSKSLKSSHQHVLEACFTLIEESSSGDYKKSEIKWSPAKKRAEMILPDMRYLVLSEKDAGLKERSKSTSTYRSNTSILGFVSFMITYEDGLEVIYVYEIHLAADLRSQGVGKLLMNLVESVGRKAEVEKCMLTVFKSNRKAVKWYERCGYSVDDFSPGPRVLRNGTVKESSYVILSKPFVIG